jgi:hypothetical protein
MGRAEEIGFSTNNAADGNFVDAITSISRPAMVVPRKAGGVPMKIASGATPEYSEISGHNTVEK